MIYDAIISVPAYMYGIGALLASLHLVSLTGRAAKMRASTGDPEDDGVVAMRFASLVAIVLASIFLQASLASHVGRVSESVLPSASSPDYGKYLLLSSIALSLVVGIFLIYFRAYLFATVLSVLLVLSVLGSIFTT